MKYNKELNIDFNNWDEINDEKGPIKFDQPLEYYKGLVDKKVRIKTSSKYYTDRDNNPKNVDGIITSFGYSISWSNPKGYKYFSEFDTNHYFHITWDNKNKNSYRIKDLELI